jgi:hypothetical protein
MHVFSVVFRLLHHNAGRERSSTMRDLESAKLKHFPLRVARAETGGITVVDLILNLNIHQYTT